MSANPIVSRMLLDAHVTALTDQHEAHAAMMRDLDKHEPGSAVRSIIATAYTWADTFAPEHETGLYSLSETRPIYARRLLLQATIEAFGGSDEGKVLRALDAWLTIEQRQCFYTEDDAAAIQGIKADLIEATEAVTEAMDALGDRIDGE